MQWVNAARVAWCAQSGARQCSPNGGLPLLAVGILDAKDFGFHDWFWLRDFRIAGLLRTRSTRGAKQFDGHSQDLDLAPLEHRLAERRAVKGMTRHAIDGAVAMEA